MWLARDRNPSLGVIGVKKLPMAALLAAQHPPLALEPIEDIPVLHVGMLACRGARSMRRTLRLTDAGPMVSNGQLRRDSGVRCGRLVGRLGHIRKHLFRFRPGQLLASNPLTELPQIL